MRDPFIEYIEHDGTVTFYLTILVLTLYHFIGYLYKFVKPADVDNWLRIAMIITVVHIIVYTARKAMTYITFRRYTK